MAMVAVQTFGQEQETDERRTFRGPGAGGPRSSFRERRGTEGGGPGGPMGGMREQRGPDMKDENIMLGKALRHPRMAEELGLSEEQRQAIDNRVAMMEEKHAELRGKMEKAALKQAQLIVSKELDEAALMAAVEETGRIHTEMAKMRIRHLLFMRTTLTAEQVEKARSIIRNGMKHHRGEGFKRDGQGGKKDGRAKGGEASRDQSQGQSRWRRPMPNQRETSDTGDSL